ncbi:hypothetical protein [Kitasatospora sp. NPDC090308]|uniref:hypothetical protein n=1 Tax=Kitasatospora sp. NPDC090308 TaxID=3364082 RepID=UPI0037F4EFC5
MVIQVRNTARALIAAGLLFTGVLTAAPPATAAGTLTALTTVPASDFTLTADYHQYEALDAALVSTLGTSAVHTVMDNANHDRQGLASSFSVAGLSTGFRFDDGDDGDCQSLPQGITTSRDAVGTANGGNYDGHQLVLVSWYTADACKGKHQRSRITLVDWDATYPNKYRKVLLVEPTGTPAAPSFKDIPIHAGGVSWYGDYLYVADTAVGMRVFDMRKILNTDTGGTADQIGRQSGSVYYAHNYAYVLPQVGTVTAHTSSSVTALAWSSISLDRVSKSIVTTEYTCPTTTPCPDFPEREPRAVRFPFAPGATTFAASTTASQALRLPWYHLNGVASHNGRWWFNSSGEKKLSYWTPTAGSSTFAWVGGGESLSYWEDTTGPDLLWSLQETTGNRNVFAVTQATYGGG